MALSVNLDNPEGIDTLLALSRRNFGIVTGSIDFDSSYPTGGEATTAISSRFRDLALVVFAPKGGYNFEYDYTNDKVKALSGGGIESIAYSDIKGSANTDSENTDASSAPTNAALIVTAVTQANIVSASGVLTVAAQPDICRNVCVVIANDSGGALNLYEGTTTFRVTGTYAGGTQTEDITFTSNASNKSVANNKYRYKYGVKPFDTITSITQPNYQTDAMADGLKVSVGIGSKLGLPTPIAAASDVIKATVNAANLSLSGAVSATYMTVNCGTMADNSDVAITYRSSGEVANGTDLSGLTGVRFVAFGWI